jgi:hypothetical protein
MSCKEATLSPEDKNTFDALMKLSDFRFQRWLDRRKYEWRMSFAIWALLAASIHYKNELFHDPLPLVICLALVLVVILHTCWVISNWISNERDIDGAFYYSDHARQLVKVRVWPDPREEQNPDEISLKKIRKKWRSLWAPGLAIATTVILAFGLAVI